MRSVINLATQSAKRVGVDQLAGKDIGEGTAVLSWLVIGRANGDDDDKIDSISAADLSGLTGLTSVIVEVENVSSLRAALNLKDNALTALPSGLFADVGKGDDDDLTTVIDLTGNDGPTGDGFMLDNLGDVGNELIAGQVLKVDPPRKDMRIGFLQDSYEATEGGVWVFDVNMRDMDVAGNIVPIIQLKAVAGDSGKIGPTNDDSHDVDGAFIDLSSLAKGNYRIAIGLPVNEDEDGDNTLTAIFGHGAAAEDETAATVTTIWDIASLTIRDSSYSAPVVVIPAEIGFGSIVVTQNEYVEAPGNEDLKHNVSNLLVAVGADSVPASFLDVYTATGGLDRWVTRPPRL